MMTAPEELKRNDPVMLSAEDVREFWEENPLCANQIGFTPGSREFFGEYDKLREAIESIDFSYRLHEYLDFRGKRVLDVGAGNGYVLSRYALEGAEVSGVDITPTAIALCQKRFEYMGLHGDWRVAPAEALPYEDHTFDCVCSMGVLHHVPDTAKAVAEIFRVLKPGGRLIVMFYHRNSALYQIKYRIIALVKGKRMREMVNEFDGAGNPRGDVYSKRELREVLSAFQVTEMFLGFLEGWMVLPRIGRFIPRSLLRLMEPRLGWNLYAKARKPAGAS